MKKTLLALAAMLTFGYANAQMKLGNNPTTTNSNALLEMETTNKGLLLPRVALTSSTSFAPLSAHVAGMAVYNTATAGDVTPGYYFSDGAKWVKVADAATAVGSNIYTADGTLTGARTVSMGANNLSFTGTGMVGIGTTSPNASAALDITATDKGFLPPRVTLTGQGDATTIPSPANGLVAYNTSATLGTGLVVNNGTPAAPEWARLAAVSATAGSEIRKIIYSGTNGNPAKTVTLGKFEFRVDGVNVPQYRINTIPSGNFTLPFQFIQMFGTNGYEFSNLSGSVTTINYSTWTGFNGGMSSTERNEAWLVYPGEDSVYKVSFTALGSGAGVIWSIVAEKY